MPSILVHIEFVWAYGHHSCTCLVSAETYPVLLVTVRLTSRLEGSLQPREL